MREAEASAGWFGELLGALVQSALTFSGRRTIVLEVTVHWVAFLIYRMLIVSP